MSQYETPTAQQIYMYAALWAIGVVAGLPILIWELLDLSFAQLWDLIGNQVYSLIPLVPLWFATLAPARSVFLALPTIFMAAAIPLINISFVDAISHSVGFMLILASMLPTYMLYRKYE
jgi:hypothetical protein